MISGSLAVIAALAASRWGAYLLGEHLLDVLLGLAFVHLVVSRVKVGQSSAAGQTRRGGVGVLIPVFLGWTILRLLGHGDYSLTAVQDAAPFLYAVAAVIGGVSFARSSEHGRARTLVWLRRALLFHAAWCAVAVLVPVSWPDVATGVPLFNVQESTDGAIVGATACLYMARFLRGARLRDLVLVVALFALVADMNSRAGLLAAGFALLVTIFIGWRRRSDALHANAGLRKTAQLTLAILGPPGLVAVAIFLPTTGAGAKLLATINPAWASSSIAQAGLGTEQARAQTWPLVTHYIADAHSQLIGVGFGPNFLLNSGGTLALVGSNQTDVRSPHELFLTIYARLGWVGVLLFAAVMLAFAWQAVAARARARQDDLVLLAIVVPLALFIAALAGPSLEGPYGAIPFWWGLGILATGPLTASRPQRRTAPDTPRSQGLPSPIGR